MPEEKKALHGAGNGSYGNLVASEAPTDLPAEATHDCSQCAAAEGEALDGKLDMRGKSLVEKCHYPWYNLLIDTDGDARPCCWADASWGNLNELAFEEIWNGAKAIGMRKSFLANKVPLSCQKKHCRVDL
jgi:MoaA/NifB/PqqE/SkfB family radical SAM enzyme